jgi:hypothetical protein
MKTIIFALALLLVTGVAHAQSAPLKPQANAAAAASYLFSGSALTNLTVTWGAETTSRFLIIFDGPLPSNGAITPCSTTQAASCWLYCDYLTGSTSAPGGQSWAWIVNPIKATNGTGITVAESTNVTVTACASLTIDTTAGAFFSGQLMQ